MITTKITYHGDNKLKVLIPKFFYDWFIRKNTVYYYIDDLNNIHIYLKRKLKIEKEKKIIFKNYFFLPKKLANLVEKDKNIVIWERRNDIIIGKVFSGEPKKRVFDIIIHI